MKDLYSNVLVSQALKPATIQASAVDSGNIDMQGYDSLMVVALIGDIGETLGAGESVDLKLEHADDDGTGSPDSYTACTDADVLGFTGLSSGLFKSIDADAEDQKAYPIGYVGGKRFVKLTITPVSLETGGPVAIMVLKGHPHTAPVTQQT